MNMAAGSMTEPRLIIFTAITLAVIRQVTKMVVIITRRYDIFILNPALSAEEVEHAANNNNPDEEYEDEGVTRLLERQGDVHPVE